MSTHHPHQAPTHPSWTNHAPNTLRCPLCSSSLSVLFHPLLGRESVRTLSGRYRDRLVSAHAPSCSFSKGIDREEEEWFDPRVARSEASRLDRFGELEALVPPLVEEFLPDPLPRLRDLLGDGSAGSSALLAAFGWSLREGGEEGAMLECRACRATAFAPLRGREKRRRVAGMDPLARHRFFCPYVSGPVSDSFEGGEAGWKRMLRDLMKEWGARDEKCGEDAFRAVKRALQPIAAIKEK